MGDVWLLGHFVTPQKLLPSFFLPSVCYVTHIASFCWPASPQDVVLSAPGWAPSTSLSPPPASTQSLATPRVCAPLNSARGHSFLLSGLSSLSRAPVGPFQGELCPTLCVLLALGVCQSTYLSLWLHRGVWPVGHPCLAWGDGDEWVQSKNSSLPPSTSPVSSLLFCTGCDA